MDPSWLEVFRKIVTSLLGLRPLGRYIYRRFSWFVLMEEKRRAAQLSNELKRIEILSAQMRLAEDVFKIMRDTGSSNAEIKILAREIVVRRTRNYMVAYRQGELQLLPANKMRECSRPWVFTERRIVQVPVDAVRRKRAGDADRR